MNKIDLSKLDTKPGCYMYKDKLGNIIYIGKAKNLKNRVSSYFRGAHNIRITKLVSEIDSYETIVVNNEREALLLENNLIKKYKPKYNVLLKDDKTYPFICLTKEEHPRLISTRDTKIKGTFFGPFPSANFTRGIIDIINRRIPLVKCKTIPKEECVYYHMGQCYAPCIKNTSREEINTYIQEVKKLLSGNYSVLKRIIKEEMQKHASKEDFEQALEYKNLIEELDSNKSTQSVDLVNTLSMDLYGVYTNDTYLCITIFSIREGKVSNVVTRLVAYSDNITDSFISTIFDYYLDFDKPEQFDIDYDGLDIIDIEQSLDIVYNNSSRVQVKELLLTANTNAKNYFKNNSELLLSKQFGSKVKGFEELQKITNNKLELIELYDISHHNGENQVGAKVTYLNGKRYNKLYRKYNIKEAAKADEYGSLYEVLKRRLINLGNEDIIPDMIIVDGGAKQVNVANKVMNELSLKGILIIGLVKNNQHKTDGIVNSKGEKRKLEINTPLYKFLYEMQEEVHRFAITHHHGVATNKAFTSVLDNIEGIGGVRKKQLLLEFESIDQIKNAKIEDITKLGIPENIAINLINKIGEK